MGGRTKKVAEIIGSNLSGYDISYAPFELTGGKIEKLKEYDSLSNGDYSLFEEELNALDVGPFDLILIGMPTYGNAPPVIFDEIMKHMENLEGKHVIVFSTARITGSGTTEYMKSKVEENGGKVIETHNFRGFFKIGKKSVLQFTTRVQESIVH